MATSELRGSEAPRMLNCALRALSTSDCATLAFLLPPARLPRLTTLNLSHNKLSDGAASVLGRALAAGAPALCKVALQENEIGDVGMMALAAAMRPGGAPGMQDIKLAFNRIGDDGAVAIASAWREGGGSKLRDLHAAANQIGSTGLAALAAELHAAAELRTLTLGSSLGGNLVGDEGAAALDRALRMNGLRNLTVVLKNNALSDDAIFGLQATLKDLGPEMKLVLK